VWGSEFTIKVATLQGDSAEIAATLNVKFWALVVVVLSGGVLPLFWNTRVQSSFECILIFENNFEYSRKNLAREF
jgi:hypothetical protein